MKTLIRFIVRYQFLLLFLFLEGISIWMLASRNYYQRAAFGNVSRGISGSIYQRIESTKQYLRLAETNEALARDNLQLRNQLSMLTSRIESYSHLAVDTSLDKRYIYLPARVISNSVTKKYNYLTLNVGRKHGVSVDMGVVTHSGVIGIVTGVSDSYSSVISLLNVDLKISARVKKNRYFGSLAWDGKDYRHVVLTEIPTHVSLVPGDTIVTSGFSSIFPPELMLGTVVKSDNSSGNFLNVDVLLSIDFRQLDNVWVVMNNAFDKEDKQELFGK
jgi:rod shape-determining protein MreC